MYTSFSKIESLKSAVNEDKRAAGVNSFVANRYPIRFVLFDNFRDCYDFVNFMADSSSVIRISKWMDESYPDIMLTYSKLAVGIRDLILSKKSKDKDLVIAPFSELARFYDNQNLLEFDALISTIKSIENDKSGYDNHRRVYIPIVGLAGKMSKFYDDNQSFIWYLRSDDPQLNYRLILTDGTDYGVKGLAEKYTIINNVKEWLEGWNNQELTSTIICTSPSIYANACYAQPDNAFSFCTCDNAYQFLTEGLGLDLKFITNKAEDVYYWEKLAKEIDVNVFKFDQFFNSKFEIHELANYNVFIKTWFDFQEQYDRWLLAAYYIHKFCNLGYICLALQAIHNYTNVDLVETLALSVFNLPDQEHFLEERRATLNEANKHGVVISQEAQDLLSSKLQQIADEKGYYFALKYMTIATLAEKKLLIEWIGNSKISISELKSIYPSLYAYLQPLAPSYGINEKWLNDYFNSYKVAKLSNNYTKNIKEQINVVNASDTIFYQWYHNFKTTRSLLDGRDDIEVYYWIDGLGIDWIPFIKSIIDSRRNDNYFLNEIMIGKAILPTKTSTNKEDLLKMVNGTLPKLGDIDEVAHQCRPYPQYIIDDMKIVADSVNDVLTKNPGRKIAIVSDHGMTFMSQLCDGLNLAGYQSDHGGRIAIKKSGAATNDEKYIVLGDGKTICALRHESLCSKIPKGSGCHGGCTPEEVLVPIFIISNQPNVKTWTAVLKTIEVSISSPYVSFVIKGLKNNVVPYLTYNGENYAVSKVTANEYKSDILLLDPQITQLSLCIGDEKQDFDITIKTAYEEEDLFGDILS